MADAPILCPACSTSWDFKQTPCRICNKKIDWHELQQAAHKKARDLKNMLDRKAKLAKIRQAKKDAEEQRLLDLSLKIAKQKADALKAQKQRLLRQRQIKQALRDGKDQTIKDASKDGSVETQKSKLVPNRRSVESEEKTTSLQNGKLPKLAALVTEKSQVVNKRDAKEMKDDKTEAKSNRDETELQYKSTADSDEDELKMASRNVYVEASPAGYAFPLLSIFAERDRSMRLERMKNPQMMSSEETLLRTLDKITRNEVNSRGKRVRKNPVAKIRAERKKRFDKRMYMYDLDHARPQPKYPSAVGAKLFTEMGKPKAPPANWVNIHGKTKKIDAKKAEHFMQLLHKEQLEEAARSHETAKVQSNGDHRRQMKLYNMMKAAQSQDKMVDMMEDAGFLSIPQFIDHCLKSSHLDHLITETMRQQNL